MEGQNLDWLWVAGPAALGLLVLGLAGWYWTMKDRKRERQRMERIASARIPEKATLISTLGLPQAFRDSSGRIMLLLVGTFAKNIGIGMLNMLERCGLEGVVGSILLLEMDVRRRQRFLDTVPAVFKDRIVAVEFPALSGGLGNRSPEEVMTFIDRWGPEIIYGAHRACETHQFLHQGEEAAMVVPIVSPGGQSVIGTKAVEEIHRRFKMAQFYGISTLPVDDRLRARVQRVLQMYIGLGVRGFVMAENLRDEVANDFGIVGAVAGFSAAAENADATVEQNNAWNLLFREAPGGMVSYSTYVMNIPGYRFQPDPSLAPQYFVYKGSVTSAIITGLEEVREPQYHALGRNGSEPMTSRFDIVLAAVVAEDLKGNEDQVSLGMYLRGQEKRNYHLLFGPISTAIDPERPLCPVAVVSLGAVSGGIDALSELTGAAGGGGHRPLAEVR